MAALGVTSGDYVAFDIEASRVQLHKVKWVVEKK